MPTNIAPASSELAARLRVAVWRLARRMRHASDPGITPTLHAALFTVERHGPITATGLAAHEHVTKATMTRTIASLVREGLIARTPDPLDGRVTWLRITTGGRRLLQRARKRSDAYLDRRVGELDASDRDTLERAAAILERLGEGAS